jgi:hypothetical protein
MEAVSSITIPVNDIGEQYAELRIIRPSAEKVMEQSMQRCVLPASLHDPQ